MLDSIGKPLHIQCHLLDSHFKRDHLVAGIVHGSPLIPEIRAAGRPAPPYALLPSPLDGLVVAGNLARGVDVVG